MDFVVGTFNTSDLFWLCFSSATSSTRASVAVVRTLPAIGFHSWLALSKPVAGSKQRCLYATAWTEPPSVAAYGVNTSTRDIQYINSKAVKARSGYVCVSNSHLYSVGGSTGEAFSLLPDGGIGELVQELSFVEEESEKKQTAVPHGDFGGLRHGSHSVDLSPDQKSLYVADIGRNAIFTYAINQTRSHDAPHLILGAKHVAPRAHDGPRHAWPHPNGKILYSLQEHSSMVDLFNIADDGVTLQHLTGVKIIPADRDCKDYWADEVRVSTVLAGSKDVPRYMYASTRGLHKETMGYVAVFELSANGTLKSEDSLCIWETPTSGGIANAIEPAPQSSRSDGNEYLALTDSEEGLVLILAFDGKALSEVARVSLGNSDDGNIVQAATAVWL